MPKTRKSRRGKGTALLLNDGVGKTKRDCEDIAMLSRAVKERWPVPPHMVKTAIKRMDLILKKPTVDVMTKEGIAAMDGPADSNAVRAASVMVAMRGQNQVDEHLADKNSRLDAGKPTENFLGVEIVIPGMK